MNTRNYTCPLTDCTCDKQFKAKAMLRKHIIKNHSTDQIELEIFNFQGLVNTFEPECSEAKYFNYLIELLNDCLD